jgi:hypothetical protein
MTLTQIKPAGLSTPVDLADNAKIRLGTGNDLQIFHDGSNSIIREPNSVAGQLIIDGYNGTDIRQGSTGENMIRAIGGGAVELYNDNSKKFETTSYGAAITSSGSSHGLKVFHSNGNEVASLTHGGSGDEGALILRDSAATTVVIRGENGTDTDITTGGNFDLEHDSAKLRLGAGNDLEIFHDGSNSYITDNGPLIIRGDGLQLQRPNGNMYLKCIASNTVELYFDNSKKFETFVNGTITRGVHQVDGTCYPGSNNSYDLGTNATRWRNIYTNDLNLSNQGSSNDVDGTWGDWTIQEGENDLFLKNNRSGKKYKFNLTEVS